MKKLFLLPFIFIFLAFVMPGKKKISIWMCGDSTMSIKEKKAWPETGWGMSFVHFWDSSVTVVNRAKNGRSTKTFISENLWQGVISHVKEGDYVFIQFGHNDEVKDKMERYSTPEEYKTNIKKFIAETRGKKGIPVLFTPVSRRRFNTDGNAIETHQEYSALVRELAVTEKIPMIDLDKKTMDLYRQFGKENSRWLFLQLKPGEHPNYPDGREDNTHFNELGARLVAQLALEELKKIFPDLADRIVKPVAK
ncbi:MAG TPA: rhamnogalacturonan acetylesterase [Chitinophagaceae bacterium]|nr:rhamnogalacturonan acetylesterase [Chitinophagaceae bacterium]